MKTIIKLSIIILILTLNCLCINRIHRTKDDNEIKATIDELNKVLNFHQDILEDTKDPIHKSLIASYYIGRTNKLEDSTKQKVKCFLSSPIEISDMFYKTIMEISDYLKSKVDKNIAIKIGHKIKKLDEEFEKSYAGLFNCNTKMFRFKEQKGPKENDEEERRIVLRTADRLDVWRYRMSLLSVSFGLIGFMRYRFERRILIGAAVIQLGATLVDGMVVRRRINPELYFPQTLTMIQIFRDNQEIARFLSLQK